LPPPEEPPVAEVPTEAPLPPAQRARREKEDRILAELTRRNVPAMELPWTPAALQRSTKWAGVQYVRFEPQTSPTHIGPLVLAPFEVELRGTGAGVEAVFEGLAVEKQPGELRELTITRDPSDGALLVHFRVLLYARDDEMRGADEARLEEAWKRAQTLTGGIRTPAYGAVRGALAPGMQLESYDQREGKVAVTVTAKEGDAQPFAVRLGATKELADVRMVGMLSEGKGKAKRTRVIVEARLR